MLDSLAIQTCRDFNLVVQDGASTDDTVAVVASYRDALPALLLESAPDAGIYDAWNRALDRVGEQLGQWVLFLGADDKLADAAVLTKVREGILALDGKYDFVSGAIRYVDGETVVVERSESVPSVAFEERWEDMPVRHPGLFHNRELFREGRFDSSYRIAGDYEFLARVWHAPKQMTKLDVLVTVFSLGGASSNAEGFWRTRKEVYRIRKRHFPQHYRIGGYCRERVGACLREQRARVRKCLSRYAPGRAVIKLYRKLKLAGQGWSDMGEEHQTDRLVGLERKLARERGEYRRVVAERDLLLRKLEDMENSKSMKLTAPLRKMVALARDWKSNVGERKVQTPLALIQTEKNRNIPFMADFFMSRGDRPCILAPQHALPAARRIRDCLAEAGYVSEILTEFSEQQSDDPFIVLCPQYFAALPEGRVVFFHLQSPLDGHLELLRHCPLVLAESIGDIAALRKSGFPLSQVMFLPLDERFNFYFMRFLLYCDCIDFETCYRLVGGEVIFSSNRICLSLPEDPERYEGFNAVNKYGFDCFPGLRYHVGWVGCGMSYKFLFRRLVELARPWVVICEDDVAFPPNWEQRFDAVLRYLLEHPGEWDVFFGFVSKIGEDTRILDVKPLGNDRLVRMDRAFSAVCNVYSLGSMRELRNWDENSPHCMQQIDQYFNRIPGMKLVTTYPFLVGYRMDVNSTIYEIKNDVYYSDMFESTDRIFSRKIALWKNDTVV